MPLGTWIPMDAVCREVTAVLRSLQSVSAVLSKHEADLKDLQVNVAALQQHVDALLSALDDEFDIPRLRGAAKMYWVSVFGGRAGDGT